MSCWKWLFPSSNVLLGPVVIQLLLDEHWWPVTVLLFSWQRERKRERGKFNKNLSGSPRPSAQETASGVWWSLPTLWPVRNQSHTEFDRLQTPETWWYLIPWELRSFAAALFQQAIMALWRRVVPAFKGSQKLTCPLCMKAGCLIDLKHINYSLSTTVQKVQPLQHQSFCRIESRKWGQALADISVCWYCRLILAFCWYWRICPLICADIETPRNAWTSDLNRVIT